jgi:hypothetical protein
MVPKIELQRILRDTVGIARPCKERRSPQAIRKRHKAPLPPAPCVFASIEVAAVVAGIHSANPSRYGQDTIETSPPREALRQ